MTRKKCISNTWVDEHMIRTTSTAGRQRHHERKIMYRVTGGEWIYTISDKPAPVLMSWRYYVRDLENTWSEPMLMNFTLEGSSDPVQCFAAGVDSRLGLPDPASEA